MAKSTMPLPTYLRRIGKGDKPGRVDVFLSTCSRYDLSENAVRCMFGDESFEYFRHPHSTRECCRVVTLEEKAELARLAGGI